MANGLVAVTSLWFGGVSEKVRMLGKSWRWGLRTEWNLVAAEWLV